MPKTSKQQFAESFATELQRTLKLLRSYPDEHSDFRPHEKSRAAREIAWTLVLGPERLMTKALTTGIDWSAPSAPPAAPARMSEIAAAMQETGARISALLEEVDDARFDTGTVKFFVAPKTMGDINVLDFLWFLLFDHIHHRGQLSIYLRMVGDVPSVYGPSQAEPWR
jgi:uncharacterized damage-inducible protein DinB